MDNWLETKQFPTHFVSAAGVVYREDGKQHFATFRKPDKEKEIVGESVLG